MTLSQLERTISINPFCDKVKIDSRPESIENVTVEISEKVNSMLEEYKKACPYILTHKHEPGVISLSPIDLNSSEYISRLKLDVLSPIEINLVMQLIITRTNIEEFNYAPGYMISRLINDSYKAGNNNFNLTINDCNIDILFSNVNGTKKIPVIATIIGNAGDTFGFGSEYCAIDVKGNVGNTFGHRSKNCNYTIKGNADSFCGVCSQDSAFNVIGSVGKSLGFESKNSVYNITGDVAKYVGFASENCNYNIDGKINAYSEDRIKNSVFKILNEENYSLLVQELPKSNTVQLVDSAGKIIRETRK